MYRDSIEPHLKAGKTLSFAHGYNVLYGVIIPPNDMSVILYVPDSHGHMVRENYLEGSGIYSAIGVDQNVTGDAREIVLAMAKACGSSRVVVIEVSLQHEAEGDNFE